MASAVLPDMADRLRKAGQAVKDSNELHHHEVRRRNALIIEAVDQGMPQVVIARLCGIGQPQVIRVLSRSDEYDAAA